MKYIKQDEVILENALCINQQIEFFNNKMGELCCRLRNIIREVLPCCKHISTVCNDGMYDRIFTQYDKLRDNIFHDPINTYIQLLEMLKTTKTYILDAIVNLKSYNCNEEQLKICYETIHKYGDELM